MLELIWIIFRGYLVWLSNILLIFLFNVFLLIIVLLYFFGENGILFVILFFNWLFWNILVCCYVFLVFEVIFNWRFRSLRYLIKYLMFLLKILFFIWEICFWFKFNIFDIFDCVSDFFLWVFFNNWLLYKVIFFF